jgi:hypothetical protein
LERTGFPIDIRPVFGKSTDWSSDRLRSVIGCSNGCVPLEFAYSTTGSGFRATKPWPTSKTQQASLGTSKLVGRSVSDATWTRCRLYTLHSRGFPLVLQVRSLPFYFVASGTFRILSLSLSLRHVGVGAPTGLAPRPIAISQRMCASFIWYDQCHIRPVPLAYTTRVTKGSYTGHL